ncbi:hypothetical protein BR93DRAFT_274574 [Coniochaeta sp. PMI_546]|nr:hypothetical protein BR93DRAFT_274574 [Coniochaeta sp. PMI_546]
MTSPTLRSALSSLTIWLRTIPSAWQLLRLNSFGERLLLELSCRQANIGYSNLNALESSRRDWLHATVGNDPRLYWSHVCIGVSGPTTKISVGPSSI